MPLYLQTHSKCPVEVVLANQITELDNADHEVFKVYKEHKPRIDLENTLKGEGPLCPYTNG